MPTNERVPPFQPFDMTIHSIHPKPHAAMSNATPQSSPTLAAVPNELILGPSPAIAVSGPMERGDQNPETDSTRPDPRTSNPNDSTRSNPSSSTSPTGCRSGSGGGSSGNEASVSNTSADSENGGNRNGHSGTSPKQLLDPPSLAAGPTKLADREHHHSLHPHHRGEHQAPARPAAVAGAVASSANASGSLSPTDDATGGGQVFSRPPPLRLRDAVSAADPSSAGDTGSTAAQTAPRPLQSPPHASGDVLVLAHAPNSPPLQVAATAQTSASTLPSIPSSVLATTSADPHPPHVSSGDGASRQHPPAAATVTSGAILASSTIATTTTGSSGRGSSKSRGSSNKPKPFVCDQCGTGFSRFQNLKSHMLTHQNVRPFGCDDCGQAFSRLHDLKRHQRLHTGARPFTCPNCFRSFARLDALNRHRDSNSCHNVNLPQSIRDVALAAAGISNLTAPSAVAVSGVDTQEPLSGSGVGAVATTRKRGRPTRAQAVAALSTTAANVIANGSGNASAPANKTSDSTKPNSNGNGAGNSSNGAKQTGATGSNNTSASPPGPNGNGSSSDSRPATSVSNSIVPSDSVSQQHARRGGGGQRNHNQSSDSSDGPRPPVPQPFPLQHPALAHQLGGTAAANGSRDESPMDQITPFGTLDGDMLDGRGPGRDVINAATESWRVQQRQYGGPPAMGPGAALQMWGSPPMPLYVGRAAASSSQFASVSVSPQGHAQQQQMQDMASPLFQASMGSLEGGASSRKRRRGTSTSPVVGGTPPDSQLGQESYLQHQQQLMHSSVGLRRSRPSLSGGEHGSSTLFPEGQLGPGVGRDMDVEMFDSATAPAYIGRERPPDPGRWADDFARPGSYYRTTAPQQQQARQPQGLERGTPPHAGVVMSSSSGANQSGSAQTSAGSSAHIKGSTRSGGPMPAPNPLPSSLGQQHSYQPHQPQSVDATVAAGAGDTSADGTPQPHGVPAQHSRLPHHPGLEVMHRRLDLLVQDNLWLRSRIVDLEHQSQADRLRIMEQDDQIRALLMERSLLRGSSQDPSSGAGPAGLDGSVIVPGPPPSAGNSGHSSRAILQPHGRASSFLPPPSHARFYDPSPYATHTPPPQFFPAESSYGYPPVANSLGGGHGSRWNGTRGFSDRGDDVYRYPQQHLPLSPASSRQRARHAAFSSPHSHQYLHPSPQYDPRDIAAHHQSHVQPQFPRHMDGSMDEEMAHPPKRRRVVSSGAADHDQPGLPGEPSTPQLQ